MKQGWLKMVVAGLALSCGSDGDNKKTDYVTKPGAEIYGLRLQYQDRAPALSNDGKSLVFLKASEAGNRIFKAVADIGADLTPISLYAPEGASVQRLALYSDASFVIGLSKKTDGTFELQKVNMETGAAEALPLSFKDETGADIASPSIGRMQLSPDNALVALNYRTSDTYGVLLVDASSTKAIDRLQVEGFIPADSGYSAMLVNGSGTRVRLSFASLTALDKTQATAWAELARAEDIVFSGTQAYAIQDTTAAEMSSTIPYGSLAETEKLFRIPLESKVQRISLADASDSATLASLGHAHKALEMNTSATFGVGLQESFFECADPQLDRKFYVKGFSTFDAPGENNQFLFPYGKNPEYSELGVVTDPCAEVFNDRSFQIMKSISEFDLNAGATKESYRIAFVAFDDGDGEVYVIDYFNGTSSLKKLTNDAIANTY